MKNLEKVRSRLNRAISSGYSKNTILGISKSLDALIVEKMKQQMREKEYITRL
ncbi:MAG: Spo0E family sporulation regulatory protein-aspartic acid phosphatase [Acetivibrionales bacterium]|jgi:ribosome modulation factor|nr:Spo0E family sporulation regulatory protein-aspartic acid phosphatase [Clostridiaceae bacterium]